MGVTVTARVLERCRTTGAEDDYDIIGYSFSEYVPVVDAINSICEDKIKYITLDWDGYVDISLLQPLLMFERNEEGEFICKNDRFNRSARELLQSVICNWAVAKKSQEHVWITIKDWRVIVDVKSLITQ
jgi:hypothetical protein